MNDTEYLERLLVTGESNKEFSRKQFNEFNFNFEFLGFAINDELNYIAFVTSEKIRIFQFDGQDLKTIKSLKIKGMNKVNFLKNSNSFILYNTQIEEKIYYIQYVNDIAQWEQKQIITEKAIVNELPISKDNEKLFVLENQTIKLFLKSKELWSQTAIYKHCCKIFTVKFNQMNNKLIILDSGFHSKILHIWNCQLRNQNILLKIKNDEEKMKLCTYNDFLLISCQRAVYITNFHSKKIIRKFLSFQLTNENPKMNSLILLQTKAGNSSYFNFFKYVTSEDGFNILIHSKFNLKQVQQHQQQIFQVLRDKKSYIQWFEFKKS